MKCSSKDKFHHQANRRKRGHDYRATKWKYHITIAKAPECTDFGILVIRELNPDGAKVKYSELGNIIWREIRALQNCYLESLLRARQKIRKM